MPWGGTGAIRVPWGGTGDMRMPWGGKGVSGCSGMAWGLSGCPGAVQRGMRMPWGGTGSIGVPWSGGGEYQGALGWHGGYQGVLERRRVGPAVPMGVWGVVHQAHNLIHLDLAVRCGVAVALVVAEDAVLQCAPAPAELCVAQDGAGQSCKHLPTQPAAPTGCPPWGWGMLLLPTVFSMLWGAGEGVWDHL